MNPEVTHIATPWSLLTRTHMYSVESRDTHRKSESGIYSLPAEGSKCECSYGDTFVICTGSPLCCRAIHYDGNHGLEALAPEIFDSNVHRAPVVAGNLF